MKQILGILLVTSLMAGCESTPDTSTPPAGRDSGAFFPRPTDSGSTEVDASTPDAAADDAGAADASTVPAPERTASGGANIVHGNIVNEGTLPLPLNEGVAIDAIGIPTFPANGFTSARGATGTVYGYVRMGIASGDGLPVSGQRFDRGYFTLVNEASGGYTLDLTISTCPRQTPVGDIVMDPATAPVEPEAEFASETNQLQRYYRGCVARDVVTLRVVTTDRQAFTVSSNLNAPHPMRVMTSLMGMFTLQSAPMDSPDRILSGSSSATNGSQFSLPSAGIRFVLPVAGLGEPDPTSFTVPAPGEGIISIAYPNVTGGIANATFALAEGTELAHPARTVDAMDGSVTYNLSSLLPNEAQYLIYAAAGMYRVIAQSSMTGATPGYILR